MRTKYTKTLLDKAIFLFALTITLLSSPSCTDRFEEMNVNPNQITSIPDEFLFTNAVRGAFRDRLMEINLNYSGQYAHLAVSDAWNREVDKYNDFHLQGDVGEKIFSLYKGPIKHINEVIYMTSEEGEYTNPVRNAMAHVIAVVTFAKLTDLFGDVPYFEAGLGKGEIYRPSYDSQEDIYNDMIIRLTRSISVLDGANSKDGFTGADPIFNNDMDKWVRFANSLKLRLAMRARFVDPGKYLPIIDECLDRDLIEENDQNVTLTHWESERSELYNPWYNFIIDVENGQYNFNLSERFISTLESTNDPRLEIFAAPNIQGEYIGMPNGLTDQLYGQYVRSNASTPNASWIARDKPLYLMNASEIWFLRAELALFELGPGDANELFQTGIRKSMELNGLTSTLIDFYLENTPEATLNGTQENQFEQISTQMWLAFELNYLEAYNNVRRTGYPKIEQRIESDYSKGVTDGQMPTRLLYPVTVEKTVNGENRQEAIEKMGSDEIDNKVWWDVRD